MTSEATSERRRRVRELLAAARELPLERRRELLAREYADDPALRQEIERELERDSSTAAIGATAVSDRASRESSPAAIDLVKAGQHLGPYELLAPVGAGGMGEVWRALDPRLGREVAVKLLPPRLADDPAALTRFEREARAVAALSHPNVLALHDFGDQDGRLYAVTELLEGVSLRARLREGPVPQRKAAEWVAQAARGLAAAHAHGIVHRDVKPENLFLTRDGRVKVLDFGLARQVAQADDVQPSQQGEQLTRPGMVVGTLAYMSPEQLRGEMLDARSDIFSLGSVLYELLASQRAFDAESTALVIVAILQHDPPPLDTTTPASAALARVIAHCLEKRPEDRFQSALDLAFALETLSTAPTGERPPGSQSRRASERRRARRGFWGSLTTGLAVGVLAGALLGVGVGAWLWRNHAPPSRLTALTSSGSDSTPAASPDGKLVAFTSQRDGLPRIWLRQMVAGNEAALTDGPDTLPRFSPDGATLLFARQRPDGGSDLWRVPTVGGAARRLVGNAVAGDWSGDGERLAFVREERGQWLLAWTAASGGEEHVVLREGLKLETPRWSANGRWLAVLRSSSVRGPDAVVVVGTETSERIELPIPGVAWSLEWNGGRQVLYALAEGAGARLPSSQLVSRDIRSGRARTLLWVPYVVASLDRAGSGRLVLAALQRRQNLWQTERSSAGRGAGRWLSRGNGVDRQPVYSPDGEWIAFASTRGGNLDLWSLSPHTGAVRRLTDHPAEDWDPAFTPDGQHLLWSSNRTGHFEIWQAAPDGSGPRQLSHDGFDAENPTASADGWVVYLSSNLEHAGIWKIRRDGSDAQRLLAGSTLAHPEVSPNGEYVLYHTPEGPSELLRVVRLADGSPAPFDVHVPLDTPEALQVLNELNVAVGRARWRPDGRAVLYVGLDADGRVGIFERPFPTGNAVAEARAVVLSEGDAVTESFGLAPDDRTITVSFREQTSGLVLAQNVPGLTPSARH